MNNIDAKISEYKTLVEAYISSTLKNEGDIHSELLEAIRYSILEGGKRVRAILTLAFYEAYKNKSPIKTLPFATSIEMIHAYSLIHDDLPAMDNDDMRRGKPSTHKAFGEATALLAGDALLTLALQTISSANLIKSFTPIKVLKSINILSNKAGITGMIGGQAQDLADENGSPSAERIKDTELKKTGALIAASCMIGAVLAGARSKDVAIIEDYGYNLGLAFQIIDDILDVTSTQEELGKPVNSDNDNNKTTFTTILGLEGAIDLAKEYTQKAMGNLSSLSIDTRFLKGYTLSLLDRNY